MDEKTSLELSKFGVENSNYFLCSHLQQPYKKLGYKRGDYPIGESVSKKVIALPFFTSMSDIEIKYVVEKLLCVRQHQVRSITHASEIYNPRN